MVKNKHGVVTFYNIMENIKVVSQERKHY